jgi:AcrR family transcriptional regulator
MSAKPSPRKRMSAATRRASIEAVATDVFAARGYRGASIDEIARRCGVTPPVLYDHFASKQDLYKQLLKRHFADLRGIWRENLPGKAPARERVAKSVDAWFAYIEAHPFAGRMLFRDTSGDPELAALHEQVAAGSRAAVMRIFAAEPGAVGLGGSGSELGLEMSWVVLRGVLQGLAIWWVDHPQVPREQVVATAMNGLWLGLERVQQGETWR